MAFLKISPTENGVSREEAGLGSNPGIPKKRNRFSFATLCFPASELFGATVYQTMGNYFESFVAWQLEPYLVRYRVAPADLYIDPSFEGKSYLGFLKSKNRLPNDKENDKRLGENRPDILIDNAFVKEYYEIKPNSSSGRSAGKKKLANLESIYKQYGIPYTTGDKFTPPDHIEIGSATFMVGKIPVPVSVGFGLEQRQGLILYNICITTDWSIIEAEKAIESLIRAILSIIQKAFTAFKDLVDGIKNFVEEYQFALGGGLMAVIGIALLLFLLGEIMIPVSVVASLTEAFTVAVAARA